MSQNETVPRQVEKNKMRPDDVRGIIERHHGNHGGLISVLQEIQGRYGYLPEAALRTVAEGMGRSLVDVYGVSTFYSAFSLKQRGKHLVSICMGTACHVRGAPVILQEFEKQLGIKPGEATSDMEFSIETVNCLGACALGPTVVADGRYFSNVSKTMVKDIIDETHDGFGTVSITTDDRIFPVEVSCSRCNHSLMDSGHLIDGYPSIRVTMSFGHLHGWMRLSCLYGSYNVKSEYDIPMDTILQIFCPHCHSELLGARNCPECGLPMVPMIVRGGGIVQICPRRGCKGHLLDVG